MFLCLLLSYIRLWGEHRRQKKEGLKMVFLTPFPSDRLGFTASVRQATEGSDY